ncbi:hypothetical protein BBP40_005941, partial [Aspergillus hancockii]
MRIRNIINMDTEELPRTRRLGEQGLEEVAVGAVEAVGSFLDETAAEDKDGVDGYNVK